MRTAIENREQLRQATGNRQQATGNRQQATGNRHKKDNCTSSRGDKRYKLYL
ncbi:MAG: hypothetical protein WBA93_16355 [Microcoleaceae cyanobacterium]